MKLTKNHKIIIGVVGLGILAYATKKYWMPKKKTTSTTPTGNVSTQSAIISSSNPVTLNAPKRDGLIAKLKQSESNGGMSLTFSDAFFKDFSDKDLEVMVGMGELDKANSKEEAEKIMKSKGITPQDLTNIGEKLQKAFQSNAKK